MDLLDLLKLMLRRWYGTMPVVLAAVAGTVMVGQQIRPEYKTSAAVVLVPPTTAVPEPAPGSSPRPGNPWLQVGEAEMAQAVQISASSSKARATVAAAGGDAGYEVGVVTRSSILTIDVTAATSAQALATVTAVTTLIGDEVAARQAEYRPRAGEQITTEVLDPGLDIAQSRSNVLRAQIVLLVVGMLFAAICAVAVDAMARRRAASRARRRSADRTGAPHAGQATVHRQQPAAAIGAPEVPPAPAQPAAAQTMTAPPGRGPVTPAGSWGTGRPPGTTMDDTVVLSPPRRLATDVD